MPGCEGLQDKGEHFQAGQRRTCEVRSRGGVGVPGSEQMQGWSECFQAGQRAHLHDVCVGGGWGAWMTGTRCPFQAGVMRT